MYSFLNTDDVFHILSVQCSDLNDIKRLICFEADDNTFIVKPGCQSSVRYLYQLLFQKHEEHLKRTTRQFKGNEQLQLPQNNDIDLNPSQASYEASLESATHQRYTETSGWL